MLNSDSDRVRVALDLHLSHQGRGDDHLIEAVYARVRPLVRDPTWRAVLEGHAIQPTCSAAM